MKIRKDRLFFSITDEKLKDKLLDLDINLNVEVPLFCIPDILDGPWESYVKKIKSVLESKGLACGMHGPFYNLEYHSRDPMVRGVADYRMRQGLRIASALNSEYIVFHSTYSQLAAIKEYYRKWPSEAIKGLEPLAEDAEKRKIPMVIENIWDDRPDALKGLLAILKSDFVKICIDVGHINLFSKVPIRTWFEELSEDIIHFHIHNNFGVIDDHNAMTDGSFDFEKFFNLVDLFNIDATYTIEVEKLKSVEDSIQYLRDKMILIE
ncbi:sugar phosphate isomerase/epimerase [bacterium]|nr:sugar phosphate isomerase/epimerase [bacterium]